MRAIKWISSSVRSMKGLIAIYVLFLLAVFCSLLAIKYVTAERTESMLIDNAKSQVTLLDNKLQADLTGAQLQVWELVANRSLSEYYDTFYAADSVTVKLRLDAQIKQILQSDVAASSTIGELDAYWPETKKQITTEVIDRNIGNLSGLFSSQSNIESGWHLMRNQGLVYISDNNAETVYPAYTGPELRLAAKIKKDYLTSFLYAYDTSEYVKVALMSDEHVLISNVNLNQAVQKSLHRLNLSHSQYNYEIHTDNGTYRVVMRRNRLSGVWLVSYFDVNQALAHYRQVDSLTTWLLVLVLGLALVVSVVFYRNFYANLERLIRQFRKVEYGDYTVRMTTHLNRTTEFSYLFQQFNHMLHNTEDLIDQLKAETTLRESAEFKQLQAQINPHFLYNNLLFIMSMAKQSPDAVIKMTQHLSAYYRYMTRQYSTDVTLAQECELAEHYLTIFSLRSGCLKN